MLFGPHRRRRCSSCGARTESLAPAWAPLPVGVVCGECAAAHALAIRSCRSIVPSLRSRELLGTAASQRSVLQRAPAPFQTWHTVRTLRGAACAAWSATLAKPLLALSPETSESCVMVLDPRARVDGDPAAPLVVRRNHLPGKPTALSWLRSDALLVSASDLGDLAVADVHRDLHVIWSRPDSLDAAGSQMPGCGFLQQQPSLHATSTFAAVYANCWACFDLRCGTEPVLRRLLQGAAAFTLAFGPEASVVSADEGDGVCLWDVRSLSRPVFASWVRSPVGVAVDHATGRRIAVNTRFDDLLVLDLERARQHEAWPRAPLSSIARTLSHASSSSTWYWRNVAWSADDRLLLHGCDNGTVLQWDAVSAFDPLASLKCEVAMHVGGAHGDACVMQTLWSSDETMLLVTTDAGVCLAQPSGDAHPLALQPASLVPPSVLHPSGIPSPEGSVVTDSDGEQRSLDGDGDGDDGVDDDGDDVSDAALAMTDPAGAPLPRSRHCTYPSGYAPQEVFVCLTCRDHATADASGSLLHGVCHACARTCHGSHQVESLGIVPGHRCDCGTQLLRSTPHRLCYASGTRKVGRNVQNRYNHNFRSRYCYCDGPDDGGLMLQCRFCYDWFHHACVGLPNRADVVDNLWYTCEGCQTRLFPFLMHYPAEQLVHMQRERIGPSTQATSSLFAQPGDFDDTAWTDLDQREDADGGDTAAAAAAPTPAAASSLLSIAEGSSTVTEAATEASAAPSLGLLAFRGRVLPHNYRDLLLPDHRTLHDAALDQLRASFPSGVPPEPEGDGNDASARHHGDTNTDDTTNGISGVSRVDDDEMTSTPQSSSHFGVSPISVLTPPPSSSTAAAAAATAATAAASTTATGELDSRLRTELSAGNGLGAVRLLMQDMMQTLIDRSAIEHKRVVTSTDVERILSRRVAQLHNESSIVHVEEPPSDPADGTDDG